METFVPIRQLVHNPDFLGQRAKALQGLKSAAIDKPIAGLVESFAKLPYCFTLQSCYGHFLHGDNVESENTERLPQSERSDDVDYRIAYVALCVDNCEEGASLIEALQGLCIIDPDYVQFGCATWFWNLQVNSYALQVEPDRFKTKDRIWVAYQEALHLQRVRDECYQKLGEILDQRVEALGNR